MAENKLPNVVVNQLSDRLGRLPDTADGVAALVVITNKKTDSLDYEQHVVINSLEEAVDRYGIDADYDINNNLLVFEHIKDFYSQAGKGAELHFMIINRSSISTVSGLVDVSTGTVPPVQRILNDTQGRVKLVAIANNPTNSEDTSATGLASDITNAVVAAQALRDQEALQHRYASYIIEGRGFNIGGTYPDLRTTLSANRVSVMVGADPEVSARHSKTVNYAAVGLLLGRLAATPVQRNVGRVKDGPVLQLNAGVSNGQPLTELTDGDQESMHRAGYVFFKKHPGINGFYFNDDNTATSFTDDFAGISSGRTIDKASAVTKQTYTNELLDDIDLNDDGTMRPSVINYFQSLLETSIGAQMAGEISNVSVFADPRQNVVSTDQIKVQVDVTKRGQAKAITVDLGFTPPILA